MFTALWKAIPLSRVVKIALFAVVGAIAIAALMLFAFPWVDGILSDPTIG